MDYYSSFHFSEAGKGDSFASPLYDHREKNVTHYHIDGEALGKIRFDWNTIIGEDHIVDLGDQSASGGTLHLMPLFTAVTLSEKFKEAVTKHKLSAEIFYDESLYGYNYSTVKENANFLIQMNIQQLKKKNNNNWLNQLASDMNNIFDSESEADDHQVKGILSALTEFWYFNNDVSKTAFSEQFLTQLQGGIQVDFSKLIGTDSKGKGRFFRELNADIDYAFTSIIIDGGVYSKETIASIGRLASTVLNFSDKELYSIANYRQAFSTNTSNNNSNSFVWGYHGSTSFVETGKGNDTIIGSAQGNNNLSGGGGDDLIIGLGIGNSVLFGGIGNDTIYAYSDTSEIDGGGDDIIYSFGKNSQIKGGDGNDRYHVGKEAVTIEDSDGLGSIFLDNNRLSFATQDRSNTARFFDNQGNTYELQGTTLIINGSLQIKNFTPRADLSSLGGFYEHLGITLIFPKWEEDEAKDSKFEKLEVKDPKGEYLEGTSGLKNYDLIGLGGDDTLVGNDGNDWIDSKAGADYLKGGKGKDTLIGGSGNNRLLGGKGNDKLYANEQIELDPEWGNEDSSNKGRGSLLSGGEGDDTLVGSDLDDFISSGDVNNQVFARALVKLS